MKEWGIAAKRENKKLSKRYPTLIAAGFNNLHKLK